MRRSQKRNGISQKLNGVPWGFIMTYLEAKSRSAQINLDAKVKRDEEVRLKIREENLEFENLAGKHFPQPFKLRFEERFIWGRSPNYVHKSKLPSHWRAAQKIITAVNLDPLMWNDHAEDFFDYFYQCKYSISYIRKILLIVNKWGYFICRKLGRPFMSISNPRGYEKNRLIEAFYAKNSKRGKQATPLTPQKLAECSTKLQKQQFNWLFLSVWLGLRPKEIDSLHGTGPKIEALDDGTKVLWVHQSKLVSLPPWQRWKLIPLVFDEQIAALTIIEDEKFDRPRSKVVQSVFGKNFGLYSGRKGFTDLMLGLQQPLEFISQWMGHSSIERTWKNYKDRRTVHYKPI